jgi:hypothetical protein
VADGLEFSDRLPLDSADLWFGAQGPFLDFLARLPLESADLCFGVCGEIVEPPTVYAVAILAVAPPARLGLVAEIVWPAALAGRSAAGLGLPIELIHPAGLGAALPALVADIATGYNINVFRGPSNDWDHLHSKAARSSASTTGAHAHPRLLCDGVAGAWSEPPGLCAPLRGVHGRPPSLPETLAGAWRIVPPEGSSASAAWPYPPALPIAARSPWCDLGQPFGSALSGPWIVPHRERRTYGLIWARGEASARPSMVVGWRGGDAPDFHFCRSVDWPVLSGCPRQGKSLPTKFQPTKPNCDKLKQQAYAGTGVLVMTFAKLAQAQEPNIYYLCPGGWGTCALGADTLELPARRSYHVQNTATITRGADGAPIHLNGLRLNIDRDSWAWSLSADLLDPANQLALVMAGPEGPQELAIDINGVAWRMVVESWPHSRRFPGLTGQVQGRSRAAYLAAPYAAPRSWLNDAWYTARQLGDRELENTGWTLDWCAVDWLVPPEVWSYHQRTPIEVLSDIAEAAGAYIQAHRTDDQVLVLPHYPALPWDWSTAAPDYVLPRDALIEEPFDWRPGPAYNAAYILGQDQGVLARVVRIGTAGDRHAPEVHHPLITDAVAARARGEVAIASGGNKAYSAIKLAIHPEIGLIQPGKLVEVAGAWRGLSRGISVEASWGEDTGLEVWQTVEIERHFGLE